MSNPNTNYSNLDARYATQSLLSSVTLTGPANALTSAGSLQPGKLNTVDATASAFIVTLPTPSNAGQLLTVEKIDASQNVVTVSGVIRGSSTTIGVYWQNETIEFISESASSWRPLGSYRTKMSLDASYRTTTRRQVAGRSAFPSAARSVANSNTYTQVQQVDSFILMSNVEDLSLTFQNVYRASSGSTNVFGEYNVTIRVALWDGTNTYPLFWANGSRSMVLEPGALAATQPVPFYGTSGQRVWIVRLLTWATAPDYFPAATVPSWSATEVNEWGNALTDRTSSYSQFYTRSAGNYSVLPPVAITGTVARGLLLAY